MELCLLLEAQGNVVAPVPLWATLVLGALPIAHFGSAAPARAMASRRRGGPGRAHGRTERLRRQPDVVAGSRPVAADGDGFVLDGSGAGRAAGARGGPRGGAGPRRRRRGSDGVLLALVDPRAAGVTLERTVTTNREIHPHLRLDGVAVAADDVLVGPDLGRPALQFVLTASTIALCALQVGVCEAALRQTAEYLNGRHQFGRPLSTFQGTMLRAADGAIDIEAMRVTWQNAAWRFDTGRDAADAAGVAKWQASERGQRTVHATQHLHGGMGADITYPIHRYFLWGKQIELLLGGPSAQLARLGASIAARAAVEAAAEAGAGAGAADS